MLLFVAIRHSSSKETQVEEDWTERELKYDSETGRNILIIIQITDGLALLLMMLVNTGHRQDKINVDL